jgi:2-oxoglutarate ferredoxin oxidoreductase subunit beta
MNCHSSKEFEGLPVKISDYASSVQPTWCGGCGNYGIWSALKRALVALQIPPQDVLLCFDIGCNGNMSDKIEGYRIHTLHGRVLPVASAAKIANPKLKVLAFAGDGATYSEGIGHFVNTLRNNYPISFFIHDNGNYGLTTGQASATSPQCAPRTANPEGPTASTLNPLQLALSLQPAFLAQGFSGDIEQLTEIMIAAIKQQDQGLAVTNILQACPTYNKETSHEWYQQHIFDVNYKGDYDVQDLKSAQAAAVKQPDKYPTGIIYKAGEVVNYMDRLSHRQGDWREWDLTKEVKSVDTTMLQKQFQ